MHFTIFILLSINNLIYYTYTLSSLTLVLFYLKIIVPKGHIYVDFILPFPPLFHHTRAFVNNIVFMSLSKEIKTTNKWDPKECVIRTRIDLKTIVTLVCVFK